MERSDRLPEAVMYEVEAQLRALRILVAPMQGLSAAQTHAMHLLEGQLQTIELQLYALRKAMLTGTEPVSVEELRQERAAIAELEALEVRLAIHPTPVTQRATKRPLDDLFDPPEDGSAGVPVLPKRPSPVLAGGAARTFEEAEESPRNP